ncbi:DNA-binding CsgD family transcriptional regulator [Kitasatospora sp. MAA4]|uniref:LuxR C-terminal-related transcriptional regulator n=1 Tax=Kitasatospora sp. MAA4 TaxID=3035093 RepID=UPI0024765CD0|nr:LuxR C-terminal-related transcriptional regulator [Kitasatospora sp. MAA4]MDH6135815.1 DNA-binding CsgD family transcriptional regulator [Kitasatospora sp. MAA4]
MTLGSQWSHESNETLTPQLTPAAKRVYESAISGDGLPLSVVPERSPEDEEALALLLGLGLLAVDPADPSLLVPVDPQLVAAGVRRGVRLQSARLEEYGSRMVGELALLSARYDEVWTAARSDASPVQELLGLGLINSAIEEALSTCEQEALTAQPGNSRKVDALGRALAKAEVLLARGVQLRTLYQHPARFSEPTREYVARVTALGGEVRTLDELPLRLMIFDRKTAFLSTSQDSKRALVVRHPALVAFLADGFQRDWRRASAYSYRYRDSSADGALNEVQQAILRMLVDGEPDDAIARRMSLNVRTCRAHIAKILKAFDAQSRVQVAYRLGRSEALVSTYLTPDRV